ncbi:hypothetical protein HK098_005788 [Nowakowskiella sp. JEL0407]|nr:hypothetical protein HK098_005788 [Nowakowskiella sp. JEL0407]
MRPTRAAKTKAVAQIETATKKISRDDDDSHLDETPAIPDDTIQEAEFKLPKRKACFDNVTLRYYNLSDKCSLSRHYTVYSYLLEEVAAQKEVYESLLLEEWAAWHQERSEFYRQRSHEISHIVAAVNLYNLELSEDKQLRNEKRQDAIRAHIAEDCKDIPMEMIRRCPAYVRAMKSDTECTVRSWNTLRRKIEEFAVEEQRLKDERERLQREKEVRREECKAMICEKAEEFV